MHYYTHLNPVRVGILKGVEAEEEAVDKTLLRKRRERLRDPQLRKRLSSVARHLMSNVKTRPLSRGIVSGVRGCVILSYENDSAQSLDI